MRTQDAGTIPTGRESLLLLDADPTDRKLAAFMLCKQGYSVVEARTPEDAMRAAGSQHFDLFLTDAFPCRTSALALAEYLQQDRPAIRVIFMHQPAEAKEVRDWKSASRTLIEKPFTMRDLAGAVRRALDYKAKVLAMEI